MEKLPSAKMWSVKVGTAMVRNMLGQILGPKSSLNEPSLEDYLVNFLLLSPFTVWLSFYCLTSLSKTRAGP